MNGLSKYCSIFRIVSTSHWTLFDKNTLIHIIIISPFFCVMFFLPPANLQRKEIKMSFILYAHNSPPLNSTVA